MRRYILILFIVAISCTIRVNAQKSVDIKSDKICEEYLMKKIDREKAAGNRFVKINSPDENDGTHSPNLFRWLGLADREKLVSFESRLKEQKALIFGSRNIQATGLAVNFQYWFIGINGKSHEFISLSEKPELIFWDKNGALNYYSVDYSDKFLEKQDWNHLRLDLLRYRIDVDGDPQLVSEERNVKCR